jgi:DNA (cytosine-5)-methyltransferase 1
MTSQMMADDGFAGAGGWDLAAEALGIHARGIENMPEARATREAAGLTTIHDDVWTFTPDGRAVGKIDSPPCQTFSAAGKGSGRKALDDVLSVIASGAWTDLSRLREMGERFGDDRTALVLTPLHFATGYEYEWLAWEQVPTVLPVWEACAEVLRELGWHVWTGLLQAEMYGVPQTRKRAFLLASRLGPVAPPTPTHSRYYSRSPEKLDEGVAKWVSMAEALGWSQDTRMISNYGTGGDSSKRGERLATEPAPTVTSKIDRNRVLGSPSGITGPCVRPMDHPAATVTGADNYYLFTTEEWERRNPERDLPEWVLRNNSSANAAERTPEQPAPTMYFGQRSNYCAWEWRGEGPAPELPEWAFNRPSTTIVGSFKPEIVAAPGYRTTVSRQNAPNSVRVTVHEAGVLQSFPADHPWQGAKGKQFLQCGNAVPPLLAWHSLGSAAVHHLEARGEAVA